jgi:hypothetical protein
MSIRKIIFITGFIFAGLFQNSGFGQVISTAELKMMTVLNSEAIGIPKDLQTSKSIVVISIQDDDTKVRGDWKTIADQAHFYIRKLGIDAVLYFYIDDLIAGYDVQLAIAAQMNAREVKNIFMLSKDVVNGKDQFIGVLTAYNQRPNYISNNQAAWKSQTTDMEILFRNLARAIDNAALTMENLLIIDSPEYFQGVDIIRGKRFETFNTDLRIDRIAIPQFLDLPIPENPGDKSTEKIVSLINEENANNLSRNAQLEQLMSDYPYKFAIVPYEYDEKKLLTKGFQFVLMRVNSSGKNVRKLLGYDINDEVDALVTIKNDKEQNVSIKSIPIDGMIYKYYVKHINSGDIYLGEQWDGDDNWQDALNNHIAAIIKKLGAK